MFGITHEVISFFNKLSLFPDFCAISKHCSNHRCRNWAADAATLHAKCPKPKSKMPMTCHYRIFIDYNI